MALDFAATYKVLVLGDSNVGKTCIVHRYCDERYYDTYISTIGKLFMGGKTGIQFFHQLSKIDPTQRGEQIRCDKPTDASYSKLPAWILL